MLRLLKLEYYKNIGYKPFKIFTGLYFGIFILLLFIGLVDFDLLGQKINLKEQGMYNFPEIWNFTTYTVALLKIFIGLIIIYSISQEFTNRMFKQNIIDGLSRKEFIVSKLLSISLITLISSLLVFIITLFIGFSYSEQTTSDLVWKESFFIGNYCIKLFTFFTFLMFITILVRKSTFAFLLLFVLWVGESILSGIEVSIAKKAAVTKEAIANLKQHFFFSDLLPLHSMSSLIPNPTDRLKIVQALVASEHNFDYPLKSFIMCLLWSGLFIFGSYWILKKRDW
ncbi:MAG: ABC transporter permease subunit [Limnohabitans sp.]|nr:ABC transporter permease subunit [Limnohabitans sp.]